MVRKSHYDVLSIKKLMYLHPIETDMISYEIIIDNSLSNYCL